FRMQHPSFRPINQHEFWLIVQFGADNWCYFKFKAQETNSTKPTLWNRACASRSSARRGI
ncbi:MAG TPA: hypothetical protein V6C64_04275, partial [Microcoleaceae cyanobacterium]